VCVHVLRIKTNANHLNKHGGKAKGDNMTKAKDDMTITELQTNELLNTEASAIEKNIKTAHNYYDVKNLLTVLTKFATSEVGSNAKIILVLPEGRNPMQKEFNIREITLVENKIVGSREKYRCAILVQ